MSILSQRVSLKKESGRLPVSIRVRGGMKIPTNATKSIPGALAIYEAAKRGVFSFKDAEKQILDKFELKNPFFPTNTRYFNLHPSEVEGGQPVIDAIIDLYGEIKEGDPEKRLYSFPVMFPDLPGGVDGFFPSAYKVDVGVKKYFSREGEDGQRRCLYLKEVDNSNQAKRKKYVSRTQADAVIRGDCDPGSCMEYGAGTCKFRGELYFYIPGIQGSGYCMLQTGSMYSAEDIYVRLQELMRLCGGVLPKADNEGRPVFHLTKVKKEVTYFDGNTPKKSTPWMLSIESSIAPAKILMIEEQKRLRLVAPEKDSAYQNSTPAAWLVQPEQEEEAEDNAPLNDVQVIEPKPVGQAHSEKVQAVVSVVAHTAAKEIEEAKVVKLNAGPVLDIANAPINDFIRFCDANNLGNSATNWAFAKFGDDWDTEAHIQSVLDELQAIAKSSVSGFMIDYLKLFELLYGNKIPVKELALPYFKSIYGSLQKKEGVIGATSKLKEMLEIGPNAAIAHMEASLKKVA